MPSANKLHFSIFTVRCLSVLYPLGGNVIGGAHVLGLPTLEVETRIIQGVLGVLPNWVLDLGRQRFLICKSLLCIRTPAK